MEEAIGGERIIISAYLLKVAAWQSYFCHLFSKKTNPCLNILREEQKEVTSDAKPIIPNTLRVEAVLGFKVGAVLG